MHLISLFRSQTFLCNVNEVFFMSSHFCPVKNFWRKKLNKKNATVATSRTRIQVNNGWPLDLNAAQARTDQSRFLISWSKDSSKVLRSCFFHFVDIGLLTLFLIFFLFALFLYILGEFCFCIKKWYLQVFSWRIITVAGVGFRRKKKFEKRKFLEWRQPSS